MHNWNESLIVNSGARAPISHSDTCKLMPDIIGGDFPSRQKVTFWILFCEAVKGKRKYFSYMINRHTLCFHSCLNNNLLLMPNRGALSTLSVLTMLGNMKTCSYM